EQAAFAQVGQMYLKSGGGHRHQRVRRVARRVDLVRGELHLVAGDACHRARGGADLGGKIGEGGEVVAVQRDLAGELGAGELHAVAGIAGEADDRVLEIAGRLGARFGGAHWADPFGWVWWAWSWKISVERWERRDCSAADGPGHDAPPLGLASPCT